MRGCDAMSTQVHRVDARLPASPLAMFANQWNHRGLTLQLAKREVAGRYRGSVAGLAWSFISPLLMLVIYTFFFSVVFKARWTQAPGEDKVDFAFPLFCGLIAYAMFAECVNRAPSLVIANANYVKRVVFPLDILPMVVLLSALFHAMVSLVVLLVAIAATGRQVHAAAFLVPVLLLPLALVSLGLSWLLASVGTFVRDTSQFALFFTTAAMFLSPVFFPMSAMPVEFRGPMALNPLTQAIEQMRQAIIWGGLPPIGAYLAQLAVGLAVAWAGFWWFQRTRRGFADVI